MIVVDKIIQVMKVNTMIRHNGVDDIYIWDGISAINIRLNPNDTKDIPLIQTMAGRRVRVVLEVLDDNIPPRPPSPAPSVNTPRCRCIGGCHHK